MDEDLEAKCVIIGDGNVGKSSMISAFIKSEFLAEYKPTVFDTHQKTVVVDGRKIKISYLDTAGKNAFQEYELWTTLGQMLFYFAFLWSIKNQWWMSGIDGTKKLKHIAQEYQF